MGEFLVEDPAAHPPNTSWRTTNYQLARPLATGAFPISPGGYSNAVTQGRPFSMYNAHTGLAMSALGQQPPPAPGIPGAAPKTFSGSYSPHGADEESYQPSSTIANSSGKPPS
ncbi:hypothetical protein KUCAC02_027446 [Chaenocephalus aceratus]|uniref:Uncharacterized protein n=1 Tax=Chaenocephalus aceratus TaxID=36190 RepID=A0ACB9W3T9_CHAAC|nr:hypothetical protein KUCAC02_027446 [Chaenocephalus aceratus]